MLNRSTAAEKEDHLPTANDVAKVFGIVEDDKNLNRDATSDEQIGLQELDVSIVATGVGAGVIVKVEDGDNALVPEYSPQQVESFTNAKQEQLVSGAIPDDDEIVYDAPKPRLSRAATPVVVLSGGSSSVAAKVEEPGITMESLAFKFEKSATIVPSERPFTGNRTPIKIRPTRKGKEPIRFGAFGAQLEEQRLHDMIDSSHNKRERRYGSDIEWGNEEEQSDEEEPGDDMLDSDVDQKHYHGFLNSIRSINGSNHITIDDLNDVERNRKEDEDDEPASDEEEVTEEEDDEEIELSESEADDAQPSGSSFQARLARIRKQTRESKSPFALAERFDDLEDLEGSDIMDILEVRLKLNLSSTSTWVLRLFWLSTTMLSIVMMMMMSTPVSPVLFFDQDAHFSPEQSGHSKYIPTHLKAQWERDRAKKAESKRARRLARIQQNSLKPKERKKLRKKSELQLLQAGLLAPASSSTPRLELVDVEVLLREYVADIGNDSPLKLPPLDKETRAKIHQLAHAFHLRSKSQGYGEDRFITLFKTSKTGMPTKEWQVDKLLRGRSQQGRHIVRHKEGDEVGKSAPKISEGNLGFKLLQQMGSAF